MCLYASALPPRPPSSPTQCCQIAKTLSEPISRYCQVVLDSCAYAGTGNVLMVQELLALCGEHIETTDDTAWKVRGVGVDADVGAREGGEGRGGGWWVLLLGQWDGRQGSRVGRRGIRGLYAASASMPWTLTGIRGVAMLSKLPRGVCVQHCLSPRLALHCMTRQSVHQAPAAACSLPVSRAPRPCP
jgi:hypothetical protein